MKTALVTGASSGIGKAIASALLKEGMTVIGLCRSVDQLPDGVKPLACDLRDESAIKVAYVTRRAKVIFPKIENAKLETGPVA